MIILLHMNTKIILLLLGFLAFTSLSLAQDYTFRVMASKGDNKVKSQGTAWEMVKTGAKLNLGDKLKLKSGNYLGLVYKSGKTLELKIAGTYEITQLADTIRASQSSIISKYAGFVISKMSPEVIEENRKKYASVTGSGERGIISSDILLYLPKTTFLFGNEAVIRWRYTEKEMTYLITFKDISGEEIFSDECVDPFYKVNFSDSKFEKVLVSDLYIVHVTIKGNEKIESQKVLIKHLNKSENGQIAKDVKAMQSNFVNESSLDALILADYYEEMYLPLDAITQYEKVIHLSPSIEYFQNIYDEYLIRSVVKYFSKPEEKKK